MNKTNQFKTLYLISILLVLISPLLSAQNFYRYSQADSIHFRHESAPNVNQEIQTAPNPPTDPLPADGASDVAIPVTLQATVSDPDPDSSMIVKFYGKEHVPDFSLVVLPETKKYTSTYAELGLFNFQTQWIVDQWSAQNFVFVSHLGDMIDDWNVARQWEVASAAMGILDSAEIPYGIGVGNSDLDNYGFPPNSTWLNTYFPVSRFLPNESYGGALNGDSANSYQLFSASGLDFIVINLQFNLSYSPEMSQAILDWADALLKNNNNRRAIIITHYLLDGNNNFSADGNQIYTALKDNPNLFLMIGDHVANEGRRQDPGEGHPIYSLRASYANRVNGGNGWLRLLRFSPDENKIYVKTYSPYLDTYETDEDSQFSLDYDMGGTTTFNLIGTNQSVPSGTNTTMAWPELQPGKQYQWYVTIDDGITTPVTTGPTWSFTTQASLTAPVVTSHPTNSTVTEGKTAIFTAKASGNLPPTVQWQDSPDGITWTDIPDATSTTYFFDAEFGDNGKQFKAVFTNATGTATSNAATLTVNSFPEVIDQPDNLTINAGLQASFTASADGSPLPTVKWQVSTNGTVWTDIPGATSTTYTFTAQAADNGKQYRAVFTNAAGTTNSSAAILTVNFAPGITANPTNLTVTAGQPASFTAAADGNPAPTIQWEVKIGAGSWTPIEGATSTTYSFTAQFTDNTNQYRAKFTNLVGFANSLAATLTVHTIPTVTTHPSNQTVTAGNTATFSAAANGFPTPTVQWQVSANNGVTWTNIPGATVNPYNFTAQFADNGKQYHAVFTNAAGSVTSNAAILTVNTVPEVTIQPDAETVNAGQSASFYAAAIGSPVPTIKWQVSPNGSTWADIPGATSATYSLTAQAADNGKFFRAVFTNVAGSTNSDAAPLTVYFAPAITGQPSDQIVTAGNLATFTASASGNPTPTVQWQVSSGGPWTNIPDGTSLTYSFTAQFSDNGKQYRAVFANFRGTVISNAATLTVHTVPEVYDQPDNLTVNAGDIAEFNAYASGSPLPSVQWQVKIGSGGWTNISGATSNTYSLTAAGADDGKQFRAVFTNAAGSVNSSAAVLTVHYAPVITLQPANQTVDVGQPATFTTTADGNPIPSVQWQVSTNNGVSWEDIPGATSTTYSFTTGFGDNGKQFRAVFTNNLGSATTNTAALSLHFHTIFLPILMN